MTVLESLERTFQNQVSQFYRPQGKWQEGAWQKTWELGLPNPQREEHRSLRLRELYGTTFESTPLLSALTKEHIEGHVPPECQGSCLVFVNGVFQEKLSTTYALPKGVLALPFSAAIRSFGSFLNPHMLKMLKEEIDPFSLLNAALCEDPMFLYLPPKARVEAPIFILHWIQRDSGYALISPRCLIFASKESYAKVIFKHHAEGQAPYWMNGVVDITLEEKAHLEVFSVGEDNAAACHFSGRRAYLRKESLLKSVMVMEGAHVLRQDYKIAFAGEYAEAALYGASSLHKSRTASVQVIMDHQEPFCKSLQKFKSVLNGASRSNFQGKIVVSNRALKTEAYQMNNTLLLSGKAIATSRPILEILADDVKASHGATVGQLNSEELFYLKSRGLSEEEARRLLVQGFCKEIIDLIPLPILRQQAAMFSEAFLV